MIAHLNHGPSDEKECEMPLTRITGNGGAKDAQAPDAPGLCMQKHFINAREEGGTKQSTGGKNKGRPDGRQEERRAKR